MGNHKKEHQYIIPAVPITLDEAMSLLDDMMSDVLEVLPVKDRHKLKQALHDTVCSIDRNENLCQEWILSSTKLGNVYKGK
jgi:hypothetical protein